MHLLIDGAQGHEDALRDAQVVHAFLSVMPPTIGMTPIAPPVVVTYDAENPVDSGVTGFQLIAESHIAIHTFPAARAARIDISSCRPFNPEPAIDLVRQYFHFGGMRTEVVKRMLLPSLTGVLA